MAVEKEAVGFRSIAEKLRGRWEVAAGWEQRTREEEEPGCRRAEEQLSRQC